MLQYNILRSAAIALRAVETRLAKAAGTLADTAYMKAHDYMDRAEAKAAAKLADMRESHDAAMAWMERLEQAASDKYHAMVQHHGRIADHIENEAL